MPPEPVAGPPRSREDTLLGTSGDLPHPGCNCGRRKAAPPARPLFSDDLVIAARDRAREPELPAATEAHVLATPIAPRLARYDVVILSLGASQERESRIAAEFARHEHRVFLVGGAAATHDRPSAPFIIRVPLDAGTLGASRNLLDAIGALRRDQEIEAAIVVALDETPPEAASTLRQRFGWRVATSADASPELRAAANVVMQFDAGPSTSASDSVVALPNGLSWPGRWAVLDRAFRAAWPRASVIVLTHDNLAFSRMCIASILENTEYPNYELILIDNASTDGSVEELKRLARDIPVVRAYFNDHNAGFGPGNNQGLREATGDLLFLLNNDTIVPRGWMTRLARHLEDSSVGLIGPATNRTCNEAQLDIPYQTYGEFKAVARMQGSNHEGDRYPIRMPMMFCTAFRRDVLDTLGPLDERYEVGMFEDEDYAIRARLAGYQVSWTPEVFVHHAYHASIGKLLPTGEYMRLVRLNQGRFEEKWGICWERHRPPPIQAS